jgi:uncharacterized protein YndB with AHSA1/START domain
VITFTTGVRIRHPIEDVFEYVSDPLNFPNWNSAVQAVRRTSGLADEVGSRYAMERRLANGRARNELEIVAHERPCEFAIRATSGPTPFLYRYRLAADNGDTVVHLDADVELADIATLLAPLASRAVKRGVDDNLAELKKILETS